MKDQGIMCYGTKDDRLRLAAIATVLSTTGSAWLLEQIRSKFSEIYGDMDPKLA